MHRDGDAMDRFDLVAWFAPTAPADEPAAALTEALLLARAAKSTLERSAAGGGRAAFLVVTRLDGAFGMSNTTDDAAAMVGGIGGLVKVLAVEAPGLFCRQVDFAGALADRAAANLLVAELNDARIEPRQVGYRDAESRRGLEFVETAGDPLTAAGPVAEPTAADLFVVTGGARGVTAACAVELAARFHSGLLLLGRTELTDEPEWARGVPAEALMATIARQRKAAGLETNPRAVQRVRADLLAQREIRETLAAVRAHGAPVEYLVVDVTDAVALSAALAPYRDRVTGIVHGAGVLADQLIDELSAEAIARVFGPKIVGWQALLDAVDTTRLRHAILFGSVAGVFGNPGQATYAVANEALNRLGCALRQRNPATAVTTINWGAWAGGMVGPELERMFRERGVALIPLADGARMFAEQLTEARSRDLVCVIGPSTPLSGPPPTVPAPDRPVCLHRSLGAVASSRALADHAIDGVPVLPATAALGAILNVVTQVDPRSEPRSAAGFKVLKGVVFDTPPGPLQFTVSVGDSDGEASVLVTDEADRPRYRATTARLVGSVERRIGLPDLDGGQAVDWYADGTLFHGPSLRGLRGLLADGEEMVFRAQLPAANFAAGAYGTDRYHPLLADVLLQAVEVYIRRHLGQPCLPAGIGAAELYGPLPDDLPFYIVVGELSGAAPQVGCTVAAYDRDGHLLLRFRDMELVCAPALAEKFAASARRHADA
ncbi:SDR family NAD(P)-dependent oxidoreductase [Nocardia arthritidis]|uniref:SDR family NAD(P)-dependent oxidoreductase n=1 Tax=Nocardia arthritidis TaxID=228602 RepID=A0A6G9YLX9_9NOCA|nr:SDR family NAD(P)-dependent oxidoreductase [Nocardia arthritidis]QIS14036.1 SDR family NAD(P)-dependent oxidoreductase [Nocardia arthritidis]